MEIKKGIGVSPGVVISTAVVLDAEDLLVPRRVVPPDRVPVEIQRLTDNIAKAVVDLTQVRDQITLDHGKEIGGIFDFHLGLLRDRSLVDQIVGEIRKQSVTAEYAVSTVLRKYSETFSRMSDKYLSERVKDIHDIERRILKLLIGQRSNELNQLSQDVVVIAHDLLPSQTAALDRRFVRGFATDVGGRTSHTAIVARAMSIPAVVGLGDLTSVVNSGDTIIIDGTHGVVIVNPDEQQIAQYRKDAIRFFEFEAELEKLSSLPAETKDGFRVSLMANIEGTEDIAEAVRRGAEGVGLFRTEYLYLKQIEEPAESEHFQAYSEAVRQLQGRPLVLRTLDLGADKYTNKQLANPEKNPFLGDRSIRMCLHDIPMFKRQLRAVLRASVLGDVRIMFPMISTVMELRQARMVLNDVMEELDDEGLEFRRDIPIGMMVEVPSAAIMASVFAREVSFFSIGTNDLIQYTLAVDRTNEKVAGLYSPAHPAVLILLRDIIRAASRAGISVSVCGEMAGEPLYTLLLLGLGLQTFSMNGPDIPEVKKIIRSTTLDHAKSVARRVMSFESERQVMHFLREETRKILPEAF